MYGDAPAIHALAQQLGARAGEIRDSASQLDGAFETVAWEGLAADAMRAHTGAQVGALRHAAQLHDDAADALDQHADRVAELQQMIASIEEKVTHLADAVNPVDELLSLFRPPPPGHLGWLAVDLPGLS